MVIGDVAPAIGAEESATGMPRRTSSISTRVVCVSQESGLIIQLVMKETNGRRRSASSPPAIHAAISRTSRAPWSV